MKQVEERLRRIEMISKFREEKLKIEFKRLEDEIKSQQEKRADDRGKTQRKKQYLERQKILLAEKKLQEKRDKEEESKEILFHDNEKLHLTKRDLRSEDQKQKVKLPRAEK